MIRECVLFFLICFSIQLLAQSSVYVSSVWVADEGDGTYRNPVLHADYSDPDVCRVGDDFFMVSSSFNAVPGLPILHSRDLVNWEIVGHALKLIPPFEHFEKVQHGNGVWAPSIRFHNGAFYIYYGDPDFGIYRVKAKDARGPWEEPVLVEAGKGLIDPCPLWDDDGRMYLVHAYAGSRAGIKSILVVKQLSDDGTTVLDEGVIVYDGHDMDPTVEGPKFYKRNGYYYIFAPAGGVATGWQIVLRSKNIYGPYERRMVMHQGNTAINGPHQGAWVDTPQGEHWFLHFQDKEAYGRVVHLQPMKWNDDWPLIGTDSDGDGIGEPVLTYKKPGLVAMPPQTPVESDEFDALALGLQWQWHANPRAHWALPTYDGKLRLYAQVVQPGWKNYWDVPNLLLQKFPAGEFQVTVKLRLRPNPKDRDERAGLILMGEAYAALVLQGTEKGTDLIYVRNDSPRSGKADTEKILKSGAPDELFLRCVVRKDAACTFYYSTNGRDFVSVGDVFTAKPGRWIGAKVGLFCLKNSPTNDAGYADVDWFRVEKINSKS